MIFGRQKILDLGKEVIQKFLSVEEDLLALPFDVYILETYRPLLRQLAYFAQGRVSREELSSLRACAGLGATDSTAIITNADGIVRRSKHQDRKALDIAPFDADHNKILWDAPEGVWLQLGAVARKGGFVWGGDWKTNPAATLGWDCPHWEVE